MASESENKELRIFFLPYFIAGHMIPMVDIARLFATHGGADVTIITTAANAATFQNSIDRDKKAGQRIKTHLIPFPSSELGLPLGVENLNDAVSPQMSSRISKGIKMLRDPIRNLIRESRPDCLVSDMFYPWSADVAVEIGIPRLIFHGSGYFQFCAALAEKTESGENDVVSTRGLPHTIKLLRSQVADFSGFGSSFIEALQDSNKKSYGAIMNSFTDFESDYEHHFRNVIGSKSWSLGPISYWINKDFSDKTERGRTTTTQLRANNNSIVNWLDSKEENSVIYVSFGSLTRFPTIQIMEIAHGLESSGQKFIWVMKKKETEEEALLLFLESFEERMKRKEMGLVVREWAPQLLILEHPAIGATVTHCGWNSVLEAVTAGLPMVTWPLFAEQFYNEKFLNEVVGIGVSVGVTRWSFDWWRVSEGTEAVVVGREKVEKAVRFVMSEMSLGMRERVKKLEMSAKMAVDNTCGGSSWSNFMALIHELKSLKTQPI
uniref:Glycosyltransferase n=1 Tax=Cannabis sativa TaxID=3483 RepID=A0A803NQA0_CANSA